MEGIGAQARPVSACEVVSTTTGMDVSFASEPIFRQHLPPVLRGRFRSKQDQIRPRAPQRTGPGGQKRHRLHAVFDDTEAIRTWREAPRRQVGVAGAVLTAGFQSGAQIGVLVWVSMVFSLGMLK